jgi:magnesium-transporting ATPase (P-type)
MNIEDIKEAIEVLEDASAEMLMETGDKDYYSEAIAILRQAIEQAEQKTAVSPDKGTGFIDGAWHCQCGKAYEVTCISSKPKGKSWKSWEL